MSGGSRSSARRLQPPGSTPAWPSPTVQARGLPPKLEPAVIVAIARHERAIGAGQVDPDLGADRGAVGLGADQRDRQPVVAVPRVLEQDIMGPVAGRGAAGFEEQVEVAVAVPVGERDAVPLLEMAGARRRRHVLEPPAAVVAGTARSA